MNLLFDKNDTEKSKRITSRLTPFKAEIIDAYEKNISLEKIRSALRGKNIQISKQSLWRYIRRNASKTSPTSTSSTTARNIDNVTSTIESSNNTSTNNVDEFAGLSPKQRRQRIAEKYVGTEDNPSNSLINRFIKE